MMKLPVKKILVRFLVVVACLAAIALGGFVFWRVKLANEVGRRIAAIRASGLPTSGAEANDYYGSVPDEKNAAVKMAAAFALMSNYTDQRSNEVILIKFPGRKGDLTIKQKELVAGYCAMNSNALVQVGEAIKLTRCRYPIDLSWGAATPLEHLQKLKQLSLLAAFQSEQDTNNSVQNITTIVGMAQTLDVEPLLISKLVRIAMLNIAESVLERRLNAVKSSEAELDDLSQLFSAVVQTNQMAQGLIGERAIYMPYFRMSWAQINKLSQNDEAGNELLDGPPLPGPQPMIFRVTGFFERDLNCYLQTMETDIKFASQSPPQSLLVTNFEAKTYAALKHKFCILSAILLPALGNAMVREASGLAHLRNAQTALAVERFRLAHGKLPEKLDELVPQFLPAVPQDPFDGQPLRYRHLEKGYVIYSVDRDGEDNNGRERPADAKSSDKTSYDITFTVER